MKNLKQEHEAWINNLNKVKEKEDNMSDNKWKEIEHGIPLSSPGQYNKVKETEPKLNRPDREEILRKAYQYKNQHPDEFVRVLAQIAIYHYGD